MKRVSGLMAAIAGWGRRAAEAIGAAVPPPVGRALTRYGAPAISLAILVAALGALSTTDWRRVAAMMPHSPLFWAVFAIFYLAQPVADWAIYRRIWGVPLSALGAMLRKTVSNDLLVGLSGEAYLFTWARREGRPGAEVIRAVKDVSILSAAVGNTVTLVMAAAAAPWLSEVSLGLPTWMLAGSLLLVVLPPAGALLLRRSLFALPTATLRWVAALHLARAVVTVGATAMLWHLALPAVAAQTWLVLSALKLLLSRLPFVSNKELVFAGVTALVLGAGGEIAALTAMLAALTLATHIVVGIATGAAGMFGLKRVPAAAE